MIRRLLTCLWLSGAGCVFPASGPAAARQPAPVILISIDTLRADHLSAYGYQSIQTPNIDLFAQQGTLFTEAASQVPLTLPSHYSLFTSTYPFESRIEENAERVAAGAVTLASVLRMHGYKTAAFIGSIFLERQLGVDQGFEVYDSPFAFGAGSRISGSMIFAGVQRNPYSVRETRDGSLVVAAALRWLAAHRDAPVFVFVHLFDLHEPYSQPPAVARRRGISRYDAQLEYADQVVGRFRQALIKDGWWDRSLAVLISDHGEGLGEHGESNHGYFIYQSTLWVPLIFHWPAGTSDYPARISQPAGLIDVAPTILDFLQLPVAPSFEGESLLPRSRPGGDRDRHAVFSESVYTRDAFGWAPLRSIRAGAHKYIEAPKPELYNLEQDRHERTNLVDKDPSVASELRRRLRSLVTRYPAKHPAPVQDPGTQALLRSLGYLSAGGSERADSEPDPKDRLPELRLYEKALTYLSERRISEAIVTLRQIVAQNPHNTVARRDLGDCYLERKSYARARANLEKVVVAAPDDYMAQLELGIADEHLGFLEQAHQHVQAACQLYPDSVQCRRELEAIEKKRLPATAGLPSRL